MYAGWAAPAHCHATCTTVTHYVLLSRIDSYCEAVWNPIIGTLRYEDGKARTATAVDAGNLRGFRRVAKNKMLKMCTFAKDGDVNNLNFT